MGNNVMVEALIITLKSGVWVTSEAINRFPNIIYLSTDKRPSYNVKRKFLKEFKLFILNNKPKIVFLIYVDHIVHDIIKLKRNGKLGRSKLIFCSRKTYPLDGKNLVRNVSLRDAEYLDLIIYHAIEVHYAYANTHLREKLHFQPLPPTGIGQIDESLDTNDMMWKLAPCDVSYNNDSKKDTYIFSGGFSKRDYKSIIEAVRDLPVQLLIETSEKELKNTFDGEIPNNVIINYRSVSDSLKDYLDKMAKSLFVMIPIIKEADGIGRGLTTLAQALYLGKAIITNSNSAFDWYFSNTIEGIAVPYEDVNGYRKAINLLLKDEGLIKTFENNSIEKGKLLRTSYIMDDYEKLYNDKLKNKTKLIEK